MKHTAKASLPAGLLSVMLISSLAFADYPNHGPYPTAMGNAFKKQGTYHADGTLVANPVIEAGTGTYHNILYKLRKLTTGDTLAFKGKTYTVYSAIPAFMTIDHAYQHTAQQYDAGALTNIDFTIPATLNGGLPTTISPTASLSSHTNEHVYLTQPSADAKYFIPNRPNTAGQHDGLTGHIYWTMDGYIGKTDFQPLGPGYHLTGYGWAQEGKEVNQPFEIYKLPMDGGGPCTTELVENAATPFNYWKQLFSDQGSVRTKCYNAIKVLVDAHTYPFPDPVWLKDGIYTHCQPMPGFQRNLLRYYTAFGSFNLLNNTSDLFVRNDGSIELPAYEEGGGYKTYPLVIQNWDAIQRYTVINEADDVIPLSYTDYPGQEKYFASNTFLPGKAGVLPAYVEYEVYGNIGLTPRQTDLFVGLKGDRPQDIMYWDQAPEGGTFTEPGGQANKPYMMGADSSTRGGLMTHSCRLQIANSFFIARLEAAKLKHKLYDAEIYVDTEGNGNWELVARLSHQWKLWTIDNNGKWHTSPDHKGAGVPRITAVNPKYMNKINTSVGSSWSPTGRSMGWTGRLYQPGDTNILGAAPQIYTISLSFNNKPNVKCVVVFKNPPTLTPNYLLED